MLSNLCEYTDSLEPNKANDNLVSIKILKRNLMMSKGSAWTKQEDAKLTAWVKEKGTAQWEQCAYLFDCKTPLMCKERYAQLISMSRKYVLCESCAEKVKQHLKARIMLRYYKYRLEKTEESERLKRQMMSAA